MDRRILELTLEDIDTIRSVVPDGTKPMETLRTAEHLNEAYRDFLQKMRVVEDNARPWENAPMSKVHACNYRSLLRRQQLVYLML